MSDDDHDPGPVPPDHDPGGPFGVGRATVPLLCLVVMRGDEDGAAAILRSCDPVALALAALALLSAIEVDRVGEDRWRQMLEELADLRPGRPPAGGGRSNRRHARKGTRR